MRPYQGINIPHGLDLTSYRPRTTRSNRNGRALILSVGTLTERKGFLHLIRGCRGLKDKGYDFICEIVGEGDQREELEQLIRCLSLRSTVILLGTLRHEEVIEKYNDATIFALPCVRSIAGDLDGTPNVLGEAMSMELPVISSQISGIPDLIDDAVNGILIRPGDERALTDSMAQLLDDPGLRRRLGRNARKAVVEKFDIERNIHTFACTLWPDWFHPEHGSCHS